MTSDEARSTPLSPQPSLSAGSQIWQKHIFFRGPQYTLFLTRTGVAITFSGLHNKKSINTRRGRCLRLRFTHSPAL